MKIKESFKERLFVAGIGVISGVVIGGIIAIIYDLSTGQWLKNLKWILGLILGIIGFIVGEKFLAPIYVYADFIDKRILKGKSFIRHTPHHAKKFFIEKVIEQAAEDNIRLTSTEKEMLDWEDLDPRYPEYWNVELGERFEKDVDKKDYEEKISMLIRRAYKKDTKKNRNAKKQYHNAYRALKEGNSYISILAEKSIAKYVTPGKYLLRLTYQ